MSMEKDKMNLGKGDQKKQGKRKDMPEEKLEPTGKVARKRPRKNRKSSHDKPRRPLSAYNFFFREERARMLAERKALKASGQVVDDDFFSILGKSIAKRWRELKMEERAKFKELADEDMDRYRLEMEQYNRRLDMMEQSTPDSFQNERQAYVKEPHGTAANALSFGSQNVAVASLLQRNQPATSQMRSIQDLIQEDQALPAARLPTQSAARMVDTMTVDNKNQSSDAMSRLTFLNALSHNIELERLTLQAQARKLLYDHAIRQTEQTLATSRVLPLTSAASSSLAEQLLLERALQDHQRLTTEIGTTPMMSSLSSNSDYVASELLARNLLAQQTRLHSLSGLPVLEHPTWSVPRTESASHTSLSAPGLQEPYLSSIRDQASSYITASSASTTSATAAIPSSSTSNQFAAATSLLEQLRAQERQRLFRDRTHDGRHGQGKYSR